MLAELLAVLSLDRWQKRSSRKAVQLASNHSIEAKQFKERNMTYDKNKVFISDVEIIRLITY